MAKEPSKRKSMLTEDGGDQGAAPAAVESNQNKLAAMGGNIAPLHKDIKDAYDRIEKLKAERQAINAKIKAERENMEAKGITKRAFDSAMSYVNLDSDDREGFDTAYIITREALGAPVKGAQAELFGDEAVDNG